MPRRVDARVKTLHRLKARLGKQRAAYIRSHQATVSGSYKTECAAYINAYSLVMDMIDDELKRS